MPNTRKILIVDDDAELRDALVEQLALARGVRMVPRSIPAPRGCRLPRPDRSIWSSWMSGLPDVDGREAVRILRKNGFKAPIIMLTGHDTDSDTILGLESGANDYVAKPFRFAVLLARIRAQLRQHEASEDAVFNIGPYTFRPSSKLLAQSQGQQGAPDRKGDRDPALSLSRRAAAGVARDAAAGGLGLQFRRHHPHAGDAYLPAAAEGREGRRQSRRSWSPKPAATSWCRERMIPWDVTISQNFEPMTIEDDIAFFERVPTLRACSGASALRILAIGAESRYVHSGEVLFRSGDEADAGFVDPGRLVHASLQRGRAEARRDGGGARRADRRARAGDRDEAPGHRDRARALDRALHPARACF